LATSALNSPTNQSLNTLDDSVDNIFFSPNHQKSSIWGPLLDLSQL
jgi:hypothetical protein